jgi:hypothetical protein
MKMRVVAVLVVLGLGGYVYMTSQKVNNPETAPVVDQGDKFIDPNITCCEPDSPPKFNVDLELTYEGKNDDKAVLHFFITEEHGWYADHIYVQFWHVQQEDGEWFQVGEPIRYFCHKFLPFGETLEERTTPHGWEFPDLEDWGTSENWRARVVEWNNVYMPEP